METALGDLRVLECSRSIGGSYCGKLLADLGAEVVKVEPPGDGDPVRRWGPFPNDLPDRERSGLFLYLNANKLGVTLDLGRPEARPLLRCLLEDCDVLVEDHPPQTAETLGLDYGSLRAIRPSLIVTSITAFGQTGPYRDYQATDLTIFHSSGVACETPQHGVESLDLPPLRPGGSQSHFLGGLVGACATLMALFARAATGEGQHVDLSEHGALVGVMGRINMHQFTYEGNIPTRQLSSGRMPDYLPCKNGYVNVPLQQPHWWENLVRLMGDPDWAGDALFKGADFRRQGWDLIEPLLEEWAKDYTKEELFSMLQEAHVPCLPGYTFADVVADPHLNARGFFREVDHGARGTYRFPGPPYRFAETPWSLRRPAPRLGEHNSLIYGERLVLDAQDLVRLRGWGVI